MPQNGENESGASKLDALRQEASTQTIEQIKEELNFVMAKAAEVQAAAQQSISQEGKINISEQREEAREVKQSVQKIVLALTEGSTTSSQDEINGVIPEFARTVIQKLSQQLNPAELTDTTSPFVYEIVKRVVNGEVNDIESLHAVYTAVKPFLDGSSMVIGERVQNSLLDVAREQVGQERAEEMFKAREDVRRGRESIDSESAGVSEGAFAQIWDTYYSPFLSPEDRDLVRAMYMPDRFRTEVVDREWQKAEKHYRHHHHKGNEELSAHDLEEVNKHMSEEIEVKMSLVVSKLFRIVDRMDPEEEFSHLITAGGYATPSTANTFLRGKIGELASYFEHQDHTTVTGSDNREYKLTFYKRFVDEAMRPREYKGKTIVGRKTIPSMKPEKLSEFLSGVNNNVEHEFKWREYTHNIGVIFSQANVGEGGFWSRMAGYADRISSSDIDNIMHLPDSDLFMEAYRLYIRYLEQDFAINNWIHQASTFDKKDGRWTALQSKVMASLRDIHRNRQKDYEETEDQEEWRIQRAMSIATGFARGLFLPETEMAAFADPHLNPDGTITFKRYYTDHNVALRVLNPQHHIYLYQLTATQHYPILYWPVSETKPVHMFRHKREWEKGQQYRASFLEGTQALKKDNEDERSIMELLPNFSHAASFMSRPGWRFKDSYQQWTVLKEVDGVQTSDIDYLQTWKSIENIGYQVLFDFAMNGVEDGGGLNIAKHRQFYEYIYKRYVNPNGDLDVEINTQKKIAAKEVEKFIKRGIAYKYERKTLTDEETARLILYKAMVGVLRQRMPSKFLTLERNRHVHDGVRSWEKIRKDMEAKGIGLEEYNDLVSQLIMVENELRTETTKDMTSYLEKFDREGIKDATFADFKPQNEYKVDVDSIRRVLTGNFQYRADLTPEQRAAKEAQVEKVVDLYNKIMQMHGNEKTLDEWGDKIRWVDVRGKWIRARHYAFSIAQEETETRFLSFINAGPKMLQNTFTEIADGEKAFEGLKEWVDSLKKVATDGKKDFGPIIEAINKVKSPISGIENSDYATKWAFYLAQATVAFFRKDSFTKLPGVRYTSAGQVRSMAGEVVGPGRGAWEWDTEDQHKFYYQLEASGILPKTAQTFKDVFQEKKYTRTIDLPFSDKLKIDTEFKLPFMKHGIPIKISGGQLYLGSKVKKIRHTSYTSDLARELSGSSGKEILMEIISKYVPIAIAAILMNFIVRAAKENEEKK